MQNLSDQDIDQLFRQAADQNQSEFDPADWKIVADRLDRSNWSLRLGKWFGSTATVAVLVTSGWLAVNYFTQDSQGTSELSLSTPELHQGGPETADHSGTVSTSDSSASGRTNRSNVLRAIEDSSEMTADSQKSDRTIESNVSASGQTESETQRAEFMAHRNQEVTQDRKVGNEAQAKTRSANPKTPNQSGSDSPKQMHGNEISNSASNRDASQRLEGSAKSEIEPETVVGTNRVAREESAKPTEGLISSEEKTRSEMVKTRIDNKQSEISESSRDTEIKEEKEKRSDVARTKIDNRQSGITTNDKKVKSDSIPLNKELTSGKEVSDNEKENDSTKEQSSFARIGVRLKGSPDFSSENFKESGKTGFNYGFEVEYFATEHVSISAGLIRSRKYYALHDAQYFNFVDLEIDGDCQMWDIPLNVNYYFSPAKNYSLFISGGFSSYLMSEENYSFQVTTPGYLGDETQTYSQQVKGENQEWFKMVNISLGVQRRINRNFSLQVEPFVKIPLAEVGSANIALSSFGTYLSLRYNFLFTGK